MSLIHQTRQGQQNFFQGCNLDSSHLTRKQKKAKEYMIQINLMFVQGDDKNEFATCLFMVQLNTRLLLMSSIYPNQRTFI